MKNATNPLPLHCEPTRDEIWLAESDRKYREWVKRPFPVVTPPADDDLPAFLKRQGE